jgi:hypothetical protein
MPLCKEANNLYPPLNVLVTNSEGAMLARLRAASW